MIFDKDGNLHTKSKEIANNLQDQFTSVFSNPLDTNLASAEFSIPPVQHPFSDSNISFSQTDIIEAIDEIKPNASPGPDFFNFLFFIEKLRQLTHVVGTLSHKGIARRALPASGVKGVDGGE